MGRQPFGLASPAAWLRMAGAEVTCLDLSRDRLGEAAAGGADLVAFFLPMHTATRLALPVIERVRRLNPAARLCAYGLYAPLNAALLRAHGISEVLGGEFEEDLLAIVRRGAPDSSGSRVETVGAGDQARGLADEGSPSPGADAARPGARRERAPRIRFRQPDRTGLPPLASYARLQVGTERLVTGYTEASRGCKHRCRHCPIVPVYDGQFRVVPVDVVIADVRAQVLAGARHITFGDPDFFNGPGHARAVVGAFAAAFPSVTYDVTIKVEHLLRHADLVPLLRGTGCAFVTTAVESVDDAVLAKLQKGHTREDVERVVELFRRAGLSLAPTFVAFTPWTTLEGYRTLLETIQRLELVEHVAPIQLAIRLLVTEGSRLLELEEIRQQAGEFDARSLTFPWRHADPRVDLLQDRVASIVGTRLNASRPRVFAEVWTAAHEALGERPPALEPLPSRAAVPYLNEPWYC